MPRNKNRKRKRNSPSPCQDSESTSPVTSPVPNKNKKGKKNSSKPEKVSNISSVKQCFGGGVSLIVGESSHMQDRQTKDGSDYLRVLISDKSGDIELNSKHNCELHKRVFENSDMFKVEFSNDKLKKQNNPRFNVGSIKHIVYDASVTGLTASEIKKYKTRFGFNFVTTDIEKIKDQKEDSKINILAKVIRDETTQHSKHGRSWKSRKLYIGDRTGAISWFTNDLEYQISDNGIVALKNVAIEKKGIYTNIVGGYLVSENIMTKYLSADIQSLADDSDEIKSGSFVFDADEHMLCSIRKFIQKRKEVYSRQKELDPKYLKIVLSVSVVSLDNLCDFMYYSRTDNFKAIKACDLDEYDTDEIVQRYKLNMEFTDDSGKSFQFMLFDANGTELMGSSATEFGEFTEKKQKKIIENLENVDCELYILSKYARDESDTLSLKSKVVKVIKQ